MKTRFIATLAFVMLAYSAAQAEVKIVVPAECKNLAVMQAQLLQTRFYNKEMSGTAYNPSQLTLKTANGLIITKTEYLGGDSEADDSNAGSYPCDKDQTLCTNPAGAGGAIDWARLTIASKDQQSGQSYEFAEVVVSMGSRGGCSISSSKYLPQQ
ncbi:MAG: hypothetical protein ACXVAX_09315 [Pseudobdellovibrio sp.]